jgi:hypothetical protein
MSGDRPRVHMSAGKMGIGGGNVNGPTDAVNRTRSERNALDSELSESLDNLSGLLHSWDTGSNAEVFNGEALATHLLPERKLEGGPTRVDV